MLCIFCLNYSELPLYIFCILGCKLNKILAFQEMIIDDPEYHKKLLRQKQLREQVLAKKEARRKAAAVIKASEIATRKARQEMENKKSDCPKPGEQQAPPAHLPPHQEQQQAKQHQPPPGRGPKG